MEDTGILRALLLTEEASTVASFTAVCGELGIEAQASPTPPEIDRCLNEQKYAAVIVDFDNPESGDQYLSALHQSRFNKNAVVVAVAAHAKNLERALGCRAHFVLKRPIQEGEVKRTLRAAYDFMLVDRRRNLRCPSILPVRLRFVRSGGSFECSSIDLSSNGVAIYSSTRMQPAEAVDLEIVLPDGFVVLASGLVVWDDEQGKSGLNFQCRTPEIRQRLDVWLTEQSARIARGELTCRDFSQILPCSVSKTAIAEESGS